MRTTMGMRTRNSGKDTDSSQRSVMRTGENSHVNLNATRISRWPRHIQPGHTYCSRTRSNSTSIGFLFFESWTTKRIRAGIFRAQIATTGPLGSLSPGLNSPPEPSSTSDLIPSSVSNTGLLSESNASSDPDPPIPLTVRMSLRTSVPLRRGVPECQVLWESRRRSTPGVRCSNDMNWKWEIARP